MAKATARVGWQAALLECTDDARATRVPARKAPTGPPQYPFQETRVSPACFSGTTAPVDDACSENASCDTANGEYAHITEARIVEGPDSATAWKWIGLECRALPLPDAPSVTPAQVLSEFRRLSWPSATFILEPASDFTLVNRPTGVRTDDRGPITKNITLLGQEVTVEATPQSWSWHWDDGTTTTTDHPGRPAPSADITHAWRRADPVRPRVDVTYRGRYRLNGSPWADIPGTHTVTGPSIELDVLEAIPQLIR